MRISDWSSDVCSSDLAVVDLAAMREAMRELGGDPTRINPLAPVELVIDHSVIVDSFGSAAAFGENVDIEYGRNLERYQFLRWGQDAFRDFKVVPPDTGIRSEERRVGKECVSQGK